MFNNVCDDFFFMLPPRRRLLLFLFVLSSDMINFPCYSRMFLSISDVTFYSFFILLLSLFSWLISILSPLGRASIVLLIAVCFFFTARVTFHLNRKTQRNTETRAHSSLGLKTTNAFFLLPLLCCNTWCCTIVHKSSLALFCRPSSSSCFPGSSSKSRCSFIHFTGVRKRKKKGQAREACVALCSVTC